MTVEPEDIQKWIASAVKQTEHNKPSADTIRMIAGLEKRFLDHEQKEDALIDAAVATAVEKHVNGGVRKIHAMLEHQDRTSENFRTKMEDEISKIKTNIGRSIPVIEAYEDSVLVKRTMSRYGDRTIWWGKVIGGFAAIVGAITYLIMRLKP